MTGRVPTNPGPLDPTPYMDPEDRLEPEQLAFLAAYRESGIGGWPTIKGACSLTGTSHGRYYDWLQNDPDFREAMAYAKEDAAEIAVREAGRRGVWGLKRHKFYHGEPIPDPEVCECGHAREQHEREEPGKWGGCGECTCAKFHGRPYYEMEYSDNLLRQLLEAKAPGFQKKLEVSSGTLAGIDYNQLPDEVIEAIAGQGQHPLTAVINWLAREQPKLLAQFLEDGADGGGSDDDEVLEADWEEVGRSEDDSEDSEEAEDDDPEDDDEIEL